MSVRIQLHRQGSPFTNLDEVSGRVILNLTTAEKIQSILVKLEGESRTRLQGPRLHENDANMRTELEYHKLLYKVAEVFPSRQIKAQTRNTSGFSVASGQHEYQFNFKIPFNNDCAKNQIGAKFMGGIIVPQEDDGLKHVKKTLPPSLSGFPGEAEIKYYIKVTVGRASLWKENYRSVLAFSFLPIEPMRGPSTKLESFARRSHQFTANPVLAPVKKNSLFSAMKRTTSETPASPVSTEPPRFKVDARLPSPAILTCHEPIPLRVFVTKASEASESIILQQFQIELIHATHIRAHDLTRTETGSWVLTSQSNLKMPLGSPGSPVGSEMVLDSELWKRIPLPNTVAPSFNSCNITRTYELEVRVGLSYGSPGRIQPQLIMLPLRLPVQIYSGIKPPAELLERMQSGTIFNTTGNSQASTSNLSVPVLHQTHPPSPNVSTYSGFPAAAGSSNDSTLLYPPQLQPGEEASVSPAYEAPPSYEDAIADEIGPIDGPRREYGDNGGPGGHGSASSAAGSKSDRLFPDNP